MGIAENCLMPLPATIQQIIPETSDVNTYRVTLDDPEAMANWRNRPGQLAMMSLFGAGEAMFSISSSPTQRDYLDFTIRKAGVVTKALHSLEVGGKIGIRGPYGNGFPYELMKGRDVLFVGGGIGLAPLKSLVEFMLDDQHRADFGKIEILYGARSNDDLCFKQAVLEEWPKRPNCEVWTTIDRAEDTWKGHVGFVPAYLEEVAPKGEGKIAGLCGPPIMIRFVLIGLEKLGFKNELIYSTLELRMKCGVGKCGRCNIGHKYVCLEGPVFNLIQIKELPPEF